MNPVEPLPYDEAEWRKVTYAADQPEYNPLVALVDGQGRVKSRWQLTTDERRAIADGACITLEVLTFNGALQPVGLAVEGVDEPVEIEGTPA